MVIWGCGSGEVSSGQAAGGSAQLNDGPLAVETVQLNPGLADWGAKAFEQRACATCHGFGETKQGPDLTGVASRRTERWMRKQITDPEYMVKNDPIARELFAQYALQMANQQVPEQEVDAIIQFFVRESLEKN
jgi:mono/diheme cytochrome c family protein